MGNSVQIYKYNELVKGLKNELIATESPGNRIIVPITGDVVTLSHDVVLEDDKVQPLFKDMSVS